MPLHIPSFRDVLIQLSGDSIYSESIAVTPGAGGIAFDGEYLYLNYYAGKKIYVVSPNGTKIKELSLSKNYYDIDYDPITDTLWAVDPAVTGIDRLSKSDGLLIETMTSSLINDEYTSIAIDAHNDLCYVLFHDTYSLAVVKASTLSTLIRMIYFPYLELSQPSTLMVAVDSESRTKFWVGFKSFPVMLGRVIPTADKIDAYRILGASFNQVKASISMRYVNNKWYYWGDWGSLNRARLYELSGMPSPTAPLPVLTIPSFEQDKYRWYNDDDAENPTPKAIEDTEIADIDIDTILRLRLGIKETTGASTIWSGNTKIQYAKDPAGPWTDMPAKGTIWVPWRFDNGKGDDLAPIGNILLSDTIAKQFFVESFPSNYGLEHRGNRGEWDIALSAWAPDSLTPYYFRAINPKGIIKSWTKIPKATTKAINYEWLSDFEADAVDSVPAGWVESDPQFRVKNDQAAVGTHSVREDRANGLCVGIRYLRNQPATARIQFYWRCQESGGLDRNARSIINSEAGTFTAIAFTNQTAKWKYLSSGGAWTLFPGSPPAANPNVWYGFDVRCDPLNNRWKVLIDGAYDSGWLAPRYTGTKLQSIQLDNWSGTYAITYSWWDEVDYKVALP